MELRSVADWTIRYRLQGVPGVSFIINLGGFVKQFQVFLKPEMLKNYGITIAEVKEAIENSNRNFSRRDHHPGGPGDPDQGRWDGSRRWSISAKTVITSRNNVPVYVKDVADVQVGGQVPPGGRQPQRPGSRLRHRRKAVRRRHPDRHREHQEAPWPGSPATCPRASGSSPSTTSPS